jgi:hypothetical protein
VGDPNPAGTLRSTPRSAGILPRVSVAPLLARVLGRDPRPPCSDAERRAAVRMRAWLQARGDDAAIRTVWVRPQRLAALGVACALGTAGSLVSVALPVPGVACAAVAALWLASGIVPPPFPRRATQDVVVAPRAGGSLALIVCARYDSPRAGLAARGAHLADRLRRPWLPGVHGWLALAALAVAGASAARAAGVDGIWLGALQLVPTVALLGAAALALDAGLAGWGPGDAGAAAAVGIYDELAQRPAGDLSPALVLSGAGAHRSVRTLAPGRGRAVVLEVAAADGLARWRTSHTQLRTAARKAGADQPLLPRPPRIGRLPVIRIGGDDPVALGLAIATALEETP